MSEHQTTETIQGKRERSPSFPYLDLDSAIEHLRKLFSAAKMNEVRVSDAAGAWGMAPKSGSVTRYIAALGQYGLVDSSGSGDGRRIKISNSGRRILEDDRLGVRESLCAEAALTPKIIRGLYNGEESNPHWGKDRPDDSIAESQLKFDLNFTSEAARRFLTVYDATIRFIPADDKTADSLTNTAPQASESETTTYLEPKGKTPLIATASVENPNIHLDTHEVNSINFQSHGKGLISISATLDAEGLKLLEEKIKAFKILLS